MNKDKIFASTLYQIAKIIKIETSYDNKYNRPESIKKEIEYPCRLTRKSSSYIYNTESHKEISINFRGYFEIDTEIKTGDAIYVDNEKYLVGLVYKPMNHHIEVELSIINEA